MTLLSRVAAPLRGILSSPKISFFGGNSAGSTVEDDAYKPRTSLQSFSLGWNKKAGRQETQAASPAKTKMIQVAPSSSFPEAEEKQGGNEESFRNAVMMWGQVKASVRETGSEKFVKMVFQTMELDLVNTAPPKVLKIGGRAIHRNVSLADLKENAARFAKLDKLGTGRVRLDKVMSAAGGKAGNRQVFGNKKLTGRMKNRQASLGDTEDDGTIDCQDFLRLHYPEARDRDIDIMMKVMRELSGEKLYSRQYSKQHRRIAAKHCETVSKGKGSADIDALEDFLLEFVPDGDHYSLLKLLNTSLDDLYGESAEIQQEEFMFWFLRHVASEGKKDQDDQGTSVQRLSNRLRNGQ